MRFDRVRRYDTSHSYRHVSGWTTGAFQHTELARMPIFTKVHGMLAQPVFALGMSGLSLLLLVIVLLAVPGPVRGLYWFSMDSPTDVGTELRAGVLGWCWANVSPPFSTGELTWQVAGCD